jgi:hypothetical protein
MPTLPSVPTTQSVFSTGSLAPQQIQSSPADFGAQIGQAGQQLGNSMMQAGSEGAQVAEGFQAIQNETNTNDQYYKNYFPAATAITQKYLSLQGKDAVDQLPVYQQQLEDLREQQRDQLANPMQQKMFDDVSRRLIAFNVDGMARHATQQNQVYQDQTSAGMVSASGQLAVQHYNDPVGFNVGLQSGISEIMTHAQFRGQPVEYAMKQARDFTSATYASRLQEMANADPVAAYDLLKNGETYSDANGAHHVDVQSQIDPAVLPTLDARLLAGAKQVMARNLAHGAIYGSGVVDPTNLAAGVQGAPPLAGVVNALESNGAPDSSTVQGPLTSSGERAQGNMQVMPSTSANPGYGVTPAKDNSPQEIARVGRDYLGAMTARYQDPALTLAAYNAGPGIVDDWLNGTNKTGKNPNLTQLPDPRSGAITDADFSTKIPFDQTRAYVGKGLQMVQQPGDRPSALPTTSELKTVLPDKVAAARAAATNMFPNDPSFADAVAARAENYGNTVLQGVTAQESAARDTLTRMMIGTKPDGSDRATSMDQLLATPAGKSAWANATPEVQGAIQARLAKPQETPLSQDGLNLYYKMVGQAANDPNGFAQQDLSTTYGKMPDHLVLDLINRQAAVAKGDANAADKSLNWQRTKGDVDDMLKPLGLGGSAKAGTDQATQTETFYGKLDQALENYHDQNQKYPDTATTRKLAAGLLVQGTQGAPSILPGWLGGNSTIPAYQSPDLSKFSVPVPADQKPALSQAFQRAMGRAPTDDELGQWYTRYTLSLKGK